VSAFEVAWSAALHRQGSAPDLSSYRGHSSLHRDQRRAAREVAPIMVDDDERQRQAVNECRRRRRARQRINRQEKEQQP